MGIYLIDYENTKKAGLAGLDSLQPEDTVVLFYSEFADTLTFEMHRQINACRATFQLQMANVGTKNALDFELVTYLGYLIGKESSPHYYIVSGDKGFQSVCKYWKEKGVKVSQVADLTAKSRKSSASKEAKSTKPAKESKAAKASKPAKEPKPVKASKPAEAQKPVKEPKAAKAKKAKPETAALQELQKNVEEYIEKDVAGKVAKIIFKYKTKQGINNALVREFPSPDNKRASVYYKAIKPLIKNKKGR